MRNPSEHQPIETIDVTLRTPGVNYLAVVRRRRWSILACLVMGLMAGFLYWQHLPVEYESQAQVLLMRRDAELPDADVSAVDNYIAAQAELITSPVIVAKALAKGNVSQVIGAGRDPLTEVTEALSAQVDGNILTITCRWADPDTCRRILDAVIVTYEDFLNETLHSESEQSLAHITEKVERLREKLKEDSARYQHLQQTMPLIGTGRDGQTILQQRLASIEVKRHEMQLRRSELESQLQALRTKQDNGDEALLPLEIARTPEVSARVMLEADLQRKLLPLQIEERTLLEDFGKAHPAVQDVRRKIEFTREMYDRLVAQQENRPQMQTLDKPAGPRQQQIQLLESELAQLDLTQQVMVDLLEKERSSARQLTDLENEARALEGEIARTNKFYNSLMDQLQQYDLGKQLSRYSTSVITPPAEGLRMTPGGSRVLLAGMMLGLLAGGLVAGVAEVTDKRFHCAREVAERLGVPVMGQIPYIKAPRGSRHQPLLLHDGHGNEDHIEAFRSILLNLLLDAQGERHRVVQIVSPKRGDGKTSLAANLGVAVAQTGRKTLIIDADLRQPSMDGVFGVGDTPGLVTVLHGEAQWQTAVRATSVAGLDVLPAGPLPSNPAELLTSMRLKSLLQAVREAYDCVLIDSTELLTGPDACAVAHRVDGLVLALRRSRRNRLDAEEAVGVLGPRSARLMGVVVNNRENRRDWQTTAYESPWSYEETPGMEQPQQPWSQADQSLAHDGAAESSAATAPPSATPEGQVGAQVESLLREMREELRRLNQQYQRDVPRSTETERPVPPR